MQHQVLIAAVVMSLTAGACALQRESTPMQEFVVTGTVTAGPTCPVANRAVPPTCDDTPVAGASLVILDAAGDRYSDITVDSDGHFEVRLPAGRYTMQPQPVDGLLGTATAQEFEAGPGGPVDLTIQYDTGIR